jgi:hypothetical protein
LVIASALLIGIKGDTAPIKNKLRELIIFLLNSLMFLFQQAKITDKYAVKLQICNSSQNHRELE